MKWLPRISGLITAASLFILLSFLLPSIINSLFTNSEKGISGLFIFVIISICSMFLGKMMSSWLQAKKKGLKIATFIVCCFAGLAILAMCILLVIAISLGEGLITRNIVYEKYSPNRELKAVVTIIDAGATSGYYTHVDIDNCSKSLLYNTPFQYIYGKGEKKVLVAKRRYGSKKTSKYGGPEVYLNWQNNKQLDVMYHYSTELLIKNTNVKGVEISFSVFKTNSS